MPKKIANLGCSVVPTTPPPPSYSLRRRSRGGLARRAGRGCAMSIYVECHIGMASHTGCVFAFANPHDQTKSTNLRSRIHLNSHPFWGVLPRLIWGLRIDHLVQQ